MSGRSREVTAKDLTQSGKGLAEEVVCKGGEVARGALADARVSILRDDLMTWHYRLLDGSGSGRGIPRNIFYLRPLFRGRISFLGVGS